MNKFISGLLTIIFTNKIFYFKLLKRQSLIEHLFH